MSLVFVWVAESGRLLVSVGVDSLLSLVACVLILVVVGVCVGCVWFCDCVGVDWLTFCDCMSSAVS